MKTDKTTYSNELLAAATILRETAAKAAPGPWTSGLPSWAGGANVVLNSTGLPVAVCGEEIEGADHPASADAAWIALVSPVVAEPLATWLEEVAQQYEAPPCDDPTGVCNGCERREDFVSALAVAQLINGGAA